MKNLKQNLLLILVFPAIAWIVLFIILYGEKEYLARLAIALEDNLNKYK